MPSNGISVNRPDRKASPQVSSQIIKKPLPKLEYRSLSPLSKDEPIAVTGIKPDKPLPKPVYCSITRLAPKDLEKLPSKEK